MSNNELHLFVFEGVRAESKYVDALEQNFLGKRISVRCVYDAEIYQLYKVLKEEPDFDLVELLKSETKRMQNSCVTIPETVLHTYTFSLIMMPIQRLRTMRR